MAWRVDVAVEGADYSAGCCVEVFCDLPTAGEVVVTLLLGLLGPGMRLVGRLLGWLTSRSMVWSVMTVSAPSTC